jgi:hypothetical protein
LRPGTARSSQKGYNRFLLHVIHLLVKLATQNTYKKDE